MEAEMASRATDMSPWTVTHATNSSMSGDTFDFKELTSEPTVQEGRHIGDCESHAFLSGQILGCETDIGGFITGAPATPQPDSSAVATMVTIEFDSALHTSDGFFLT
jgi:hypothetical protein